MYMLHEKCSKGHQWSWRCHQVSRGCVKCEAEKRRKEKEFQKALEEQERRNREEQEHSEHMAKLDELLVDERQRLRENQLSRERALAVQQKERDLADAQAMSVLSSDQTSKSLNRNPTKNLPESGNIQPTLWQNFLKQPPSPADLVVQTEPTPSKRSSEQPFESGNLPTPDWTIRRSSRAKEDWEHQKTTGGSRNGDIDSLMDLIGLEEVKLQILKIKAKIEVSIRQNADISKDRLNVSFLGNPGTGRSHQCTILTFNIG